MKTSVGQSEASKQKDYRTPRSLFDPLNNEFHFTLDAASSNENHLCERYYTEKTNGLLQSWEDEVVFVNPPYGKENLPLWTEKAWCETDGNCTVVMLLPVNTSTKWWHRFCMKADEIRFIEGRVSFLGGNGEKLSAPPLFSNALVIWRSKPTVFFYERTPYISSYKL